MYLRWAFGRLKESFRRYRAERSWRKKNHDNFTRVGDFLFNPSVVKVGFGSYGTLNVLTYGNKDERLEIGNFCSIATNTVFVLSGEHNYNFLSTYPFDRMYFSKKSESISKGAIVIHDDVWIGYGAVILSGVTIGQGAVVGANCVVAKNLPPYSIFAGGKILKYRFSNRVIQSILKEDVLSKIKTLIERRSLDCDYLQVFYKEISDQAVDEVIGRINSMIKTEHQPHGN